MRDSTEAYTQSLVTALKETYGEKQARTIITSMMRPNSPVDRLHDPVPAQQSRTGPGAVNPAPGPVGAGFTGADRAS